jgi:hypothetical protein
MVSNTTVHKYEQVLLDTSHFHGSLTALCPQDDGIPLAFANYWTWALLTPHSQSNQTPIVSGMASFGSYMLCSSHCLYIKQGYHFCPNDFKGISSAWVLAQAYVGTPTGISIFLTI